jgi:hypothetical protein
VSYENVDRSRARVPKQRNVIERDGRHMVHTDAVEEEASVADIQCASLVEGKHRT